MFKPLLTAKNVLRASLAVVGTAGAATAAVAYHDEGTRRSLQFWYKAFPIYGHYRAYQLLNRDLKIMSDEVADKKYDELHEKYSDRVKDIVFTMRGFYLKNAQLMSTQDNFVPPAYMRWVKDTQDNVPSNFSGTGAREYVRAKLREEQGRDFDEVFSAWDDAPLGVASIGQVHKAVLRSTGQTVAVKLLCPGMESMFRGDIHTLKTFCRLAMPQHVTAFDEVEKQFCTEFDYREEAANLQLVRDCILPKWGQHVEIPRPHMALCSKHLLVMDWLDGVRLVDGIRKEFAKVAALTGQTVEQLEAEFRSQILAGTFRYKSIDQTRREQRRLQWLLAAKDVLWGYNAWKFLFNVSPARLLYGPYEYEWSEVPMDLGSLVELLCHVHGDQIFQHGAFNGDPHPGNILLLRDGRVGLIDYGQVKRMTVPQRVTYAKLMLAHARMDKDEVVRLHFGEIGVRTRRNDPHIGYLMSAFYNDRDTPDVCGAMNIPEFVDFLEAADPMEQLGDAFIFASRVNVMLRGLGKAFGLQMRMSTLWQHEARDFLDSQGIDY